MSLSLQWKSANTYVSEKRTFKILCEKGFLKFNFDGKIHEVKPLADIELHSIELNLLRGFFAVL